MDTNTDNDLTVGEQYILGLFLRRHEERCEARVVLIPLVLCALLGVCGVIAYFSGQLTF